MNRDGMPIPTRHVSRFVMWRGKSSFYCIKISLRDRLDNGGMHKCSNSTVDWANFSLAFLALS